MKKIPLIKTNRRTIEIERIPAGNHWESDTYDVYWRNPDGTTEYIGSTDTLTDSEYFAAELRQLEGLRPL